MSNSNNGSASTGNAPAKRLKGFAALDPARVREIASVGGKSVPAARRPFSSNRALASEAGRKGGRIGGAAPRNTRRTYTDAELDQFAADLRDESRAERHESEESYFGVSSLFRNSHR